MEDWLRAEAPPPAALVALESAAGGTEGGETSGLAAVDGGVVVVAIVILALIAVIIVVVIGCRPRRVAGVDSDATAARADLSCRCPAGHTLARSVTNADFVCALCGGGGGSCGSFRTVLSCGPCQWFACEDCAKRPGGIEMASFITDGQASGSFVGPSSSELSRTRCVKIRLRRLDTNKHGEQLPKWLEEQVRDQAKKGGLPDLPLRVWERHMDIYDAKGNRYSCYSELEELDSDMFPLRIEYKLPPTDEEQPGEVDHEENDDHHKEQHRLKFAVRAVTAASRVKGRGVSWGGVEEKNVDEISKQMKTRQSAPRVSASY